MTLSLDMKGYVALRKCRSGMLLVEHVSRIHGGSVMWWILHGTLYEVVVPLGRHVVVPC